MIDLFFPMKRARCRERRSWENPSVPLSDPDEWTVGVFGGGTSASGVEVNSDSALNYAAVWRAVWLISRDVAKLPLYIYRRVGAGKTRAADHVAYYLLRRKPNEYQVAYQFRLGMTAQALLLGNAYAYIFRDRGGRPESIVPLDPKVTRVEIDGGKIYYMTWIGGQEKKLLAENVLHIRCTGDGYSGTSTVEKARDSFGLGLAASQYGARYFGNGARPSSVIQHPAHLSEEAQKQLRTSWNELHQGLDRSHRVAILEEGMTLHPYQISNEDSQFLETRQFEIREIASWFGVPPHKLGDTERTSYASLEQENQSYLDDALDPWLVAWEEECADKLLLESEKRGDTHVVEFLRQALVRADINARGAFYTQALQWGWMSRDEVRARENMNPIPDGSGERYYSPLNMRDGTDDEPSADARAAVIEDATIRLTNRAIQKLKVAAKDPESFCDVATKTLPDELDSLAQSIYAPSAALCGVPVDDLVTSYMVSFTGWGLRCLERGGASLRSHIEASRQEITDAICASMVKEFVSDAGT